MLDPVRHTRSEAILLSIRRSRALPSMWEGGRRRKTPGKPKAQPLRSRRGAEMAGEQGGAALGLLDASAVTPGMPRCPPSFSEAKPLKRGSGTRVLLADSRPGERTVVRSVGC